MEQDYMPVRDFDFAHVLGYYSDLLKYAYEVHLPRGLYNEVQAARINALLRLGLLDGDLALRKELRDVIADVIGNRDVSEINDHDFFAVAARYREWYPPESTWPRWFSEAYDARSALMGHPVPNKGPWPTENRAHA